MIIHGDDRGQLPDPCGGVVKLKMPVLMGEVCKGESILPLGRDVDRIPCLPLLAFIGNKQRQLVTMTLRCRYVPDPNQSDIEPLQQPLKGGAGQIASSNG